MIALDTNAYSKLDKGNDKLQLILENQEQIALPIIVVGEARFGFELGNRKEINEERLVRFLNNPRVLVLPIDDQTTRVYAELFTVLRRQGTPIPTNDIWIAAICLQHGCVLATNDKHFEHVPLLQTTTVN